MLSIHYMIIYARANLSIHSIRELCIIWESYVIYTFNERAMLSIHYMRELCYLYIVWESYAIYTLYDRAMLSIHCMRELCYLYIVWESYVIYTFYNRATYERVVFFMSSVKIIFFSLMSNYPSNFLLNVRNSPNKR